MDLSITGIFLAGILTFFTPCVLPLIPIYLSALMGSDVAGAKGLARGHLIIRSVAFSFGFVAVFSVLGLGASAVGSFFQQNRGLLMLVGAFIILIFGLKLLNIINIPILDRVLRANDSKVAQKAGLLSAWMMGFVFAAGWSPCVGPVLGSVLTYTASKTSDVITGGIYLTAYGLGFAVPLLLTAVFAEAGIRFIRKASRFLPVFEKTTGVFLVLVATALLFNAISLNVGDIQPTPTIRRAGETPAVKKGLQPVMIEFYTKNCVVCQRMGPMIEQLRSECPQNLVEIRQIDVSEEENRHFIKEFMLFGVPTFVFINAKGMEEARLIGYQTKQALRQSISAAAGEACPNIGALP